MGDRTINLSAEHFGLKIDEATKRACEESSLIEALEWIAVWESERAIKQAVAYVRTGVSTAAPGQGWDTCFGFCFRHVVEEWKACHPEAHGMIAL